MQDDEQMCSSVMSYDKWHFVTHLCLVQTGFELMRHRI